MSLDEAIRSALEEYDNSWKTGDAHVNYDQAAHDAVAAIRLAFEAEGRISNPVGQLQILTVSQGRTMPEYRISQTGELKTGTAFTCECTAVNVTRSAQAISKKQAKRRAARAVLEDVVRE